MGLIERLGQLISGTSNPGEQIRSGQVKGVDRWSLKDYRESLEAHLRVNVELQTQQAALLAEMQSRLDAERKVAEELSQNRWERTKTLREESGIEILISELAKLIEQDPTKQSPKGRQHLPVSGTIDEERSYPSVSYSPIEWVGHNILSKHPYDKDSMLDAVIWWDGEKRVLKTTKSSATEHQYIKYFIVEVTPEGDIAFHSKKRNLVSANLWRRDRSSLENILGEAFSNPAIFPYENTYGTWRRPEGFTGGNTG